LHKKTLPSQQTKVQLQIVAEYITLQQQGYQIALAINLVRSLAEAVAIA
jgi:hypothetical protein